MSRLLRVLAAVGLLMLVAPRWAAAQGAPGQTRTTGDVAAGIARLAAAQQDAAEGGQSKPSTFRISLDGQEIELAGAVKILALLTLITLAPSILLLMTCFTRIIIVFSFLRHALATQQMPPNQVLIGLALFLTLFVMAPVWLQIEQQALAPYEKGEITREVAIERGVAPIKRFMLRQTRSEDLALFYQMSNAGRPDTDEDVSLLALVPAYVISELRTAFQMGFLLFLPFLLVDMVVAATLMGMGMMMLPPVIVSLPLKVMLFVLADGWHMVVGSLVRSFGP